MIDSDSADMKIRKLPLSGVLRGQGHRYKKVGGIRLEPQSFEGHVAVCTIYSKIVFKIITCNLFVF